jgi:putative inorganic carbon (HCO3(-)) transporter
MPASTTSRSPSTLSARLLLGAAAFVGVQIPLASRATAGAQATQIVVSDLFLVALTLVAGFVVVRGRCGRWLLFLAYVALNALVLGSLSRYALVNKVGGLALLVFSCQAAVVVLRSAGPALATRALWAMVNTTAFSAGVGVAASLSGLTLTLPFGIQVNPYRPRVSGLMVDPNAFGALVAVCLVICLVGWRDSQHSQRWFAWVRLVVLVAALVMSYSRTGWIAAAFGLLMWFMTSSARTRVRVAVSVAALAVVAIWRGAALPVDSELAGRQFTIDQRTEGALSALGDFARSPLLGIGTGNHVAENSFIVHNTYLWVLGELGFIGFVLFAWSVLGVVAALRSIHPTRRVLQRTLVCTLAAMAVTALGIEALYQRHLWVLFALAYAAASMTPKDEAAPATTVSDAAPLVSPRRAGPAPAHERGRR